MSRKLPLLAAGFAAMLMLGGSAIATAAADTDRDTIPDAGDNCLSVYNPDQFDRDGDGVGNTCDTTPGIPVGESWVIYYHRDVLTGGPLPSPVTLRLVQYQGATVLWSSEFMHQQYTWTWASQADVRAELTRLQKPAGCIALWPSPTVHHFGNGSALNGGSWSVKTLRYVCLPSLLAPGAAG